MEYTNTNLCLICDLDPNCYLGKLFMYLLKLFCEGKIYA